jgi:hypothetical protein
MADQYVQVQPNSTGLKVDTSELTVGANTVERQRVVIGDPTVAAGLVTVTSNALDVNVKTSALTDAAEVAQGTTAPTKVLVVGGKSNDGTPQYKEVPLGASARSVIVEGVAGGTAVPVSLAAETTKVLGTTRTIGNTGATLDAAQNAAAPANELVAGAVYNTTIPTLTAGNATQIQADVTGALYINPESRKASYSSSASFTPVAGDIVAMPGSATKTIRITRVEVSLSTTGTAALATLSLIRRSTADSAGTPASMITVPHDSAFAIASALPVNYTAAPTLGTSQGAIRSVIMNDGSAAVPGANTWLWTFGGDRPSGAFVLRGVAQQLGINLSAVVATQTAMVSIEWTEE